MDQRSASSAIFKRFIAKWATAQSAVPYSVDNQKVPEPRDGRLARVRVISGLSRIYTLGPGGQQQRSGQISVRLSDKPNIGRGNMDDMISTVRGIFERKRFANDGGADEFGIVTYATTPNERYNDRDYPQLWVVEVLTPFEFYEQTPAI